LFSWPRYEQPTPAQPAFTILNIRAPHMPYSEHAPEHPVFAATKTGDTIEDTRNEYDDAMLTADGIITASIETLLARDPRPTVVILTADHGENMGEEGRFGHNRLNLSTATVPFVMIAANWPKERAVPAADCVGNHYRLGVFMLEQMGFRLHNPNDVDGTTYYVNGNDIFGNNGELEYKLPPCSGAQNRLARSKLKALSASSPCIRADDIRALLL
jgi:membrane-anchored protein YejM (alkaline phosphatase superfamily)